MGPNSVKTDSIAHDNFNAALMLSDASVTPQEVPIYIRDALSFADQSKIGKCDGVIGIRLSWVRQSTKPANPFPVQY